MDWGPGHTVLAVMVPPLEEFVRSRTAHYDPAFVSDDPGFAHAHLTLLAPFLPDPAHDRLQVLAPLLQRHLPVEMELVEVGVFPNGLIHAVPAPPEPFVRLTEALVAAFPECPPYRGAFDPQPHVTLDHSSAVDPDEVRRQLSAVLPVTFRADTVQLQWWEAGDCRVMEEWSW